VIRHSSFAVDPWAIRESSFCLDLLARSESVFSLANGHIGMRGNLDEGSPSALPGTYLSGFYDYHPLPNAEPAYGYPSTGQAIVNVPDAKLIRLLVDGEPFDLRTGTLQNHSRILDMRNGTLVRRLTWTSPGGSTVKLRSSRMVSLTQRSVAAIRYEVSIPRKARSDDHEVQSRDDAIRLVVQSELVADEQVPQRSTDDPRAATPQEARLVLESSYIEGFRMEMICRTASSALRVVSSVDHLLRHSRRTSGPSAASNAYRAEASIEEGRGHCTVTTALHPGESFVLTKLIAYDSSSDLSDLAVRDAVAAALASARDSGWDGLVGEQQAFLANFWARADVEVGGDPEIQQAVRFALFHVLQAAARAERNPIPAKGLTGTGYEGHVFWDMETFVLRVLTYLYPRAAADAIHWRHSTLPSARRQARELHLAGAAFPWRTINGEPSSGYWPASTAAMHINADIADALTRYVDATGDLELEQAAGVEILVETARLWSSLGYFDAGGSFHIDGVTGPDEYSALVDDNIFTNLMARQNLLSAAQAARRHPSEAERLAVTSEEVSAWEVKAHSIYVPYDDILAIHAQDRSFTSHEHWDFEATDASEYPLLLHRPYMELYRKQVVKQADLVLAMFLQGGALYEGLTPEDSISQKERDFAYYEALTVRDSSLSACIQAIVAAEVGQMDLAYDYVREAALLDLDDLECNTSDGLHIASLAGTWLSLVAGLGGMRASDGQISFSPRLPTGIASLAFRVTYQGRLVIVSITPDNASYSLLGDEPLTITHHGTGFKLSAGSTITMAIPHMAAGPRPSQPAGREPEAARLPGKGRSGGRATGTDVTQRKNKDTDKDKRTA